MFLQSLYFVLFTFLCVSSMNLTAHGNEQEPTNSNVSEYEVQEFEFNHVLKDLASISIKNQSQLTLASEKSGNSKKTEKEIRIRRERALYIQAHQLALDEGKYLNVTKPSAFSCLSCFLPKR